MSQEYFVCQNIFQPFPESPTQSKAISFSFGLTISKTMKDVCYVHATSMGRTFGGLVGFLSDFVLSLQLIKKEKWI